ncbi:MAG TPA: outer membrane protein transport protein [Longimicrobiales bacterium]
MRHFRPSRAWLLAGAAVLAVPAVAAAQGSAVYTQSACMNARNGAGIAAPCSDGSAVYYNPAALAVQNGAASVGATVIEQSGTFTYDTSALEIERPPRSIVVPHGYATWRPAERIGVGLGVWAPYGLSIDWPVCPPDQSRCATNFEGRFVGYDQSLRALYFQPTVAYAVIPGLLSIGAGLDVVKGEVEIARRIDLAGQPAGPFLFRDLGIPRGTDFADARVKGDAWGFTGHVGLLLELGAFSFGARYLHSTRLDFEGDAEFRQVATGRTIGPLPPIVPAAVSLDEFILAAGTFDEGGAAADQQFTASITMPAQAIVGVAVRLGPTMRIMADYQWTQWSAWDEVDVDFSNDATPDETLVFAYEDASTFRFGADYAYSDRITLRAGYTRAQPAAGPASVSPFLPDSERAFFSGGISFRASERLSVDVFGMGVDAAARRGRVVNRPVGLTEDEAEALNEGLYTSEGTLFGATLSYHFGGPR